MFYQKKFDKNHRISNVVLSLPIAITLQSINLMTILLRHMHAMTSIKIINIISILKNKPNNNIVFLKSYEFFCDMLYKLC